MGDTFPSRRGGRKGFPAPRWERSGARESALASVRAPRLVPFSSTTTFWRTEWESDPTRPRRGRGPHTDCGPSILSTTTYCADGPPSVVDGIPPLHMWWWAPVITDGAQKSTNAAERPPSGERAAASVADFSLHPGGRSEREDSIRPCEETGASRRTTRGSGLPIARYCTVGPDPEIRPPSSPPQGGHRSLGPSAKLPQTARNVQNGHQTIALVVFPSSLSSSLVPYQYRWMESETLIRR